MTPSMRSISGFVFLVFYFLVFDGIAAEQERCFGTNSRYSHNVDKLENYRRLKWRYTNCTIVQGNLEIGGLPENVDLSFLKDIEIVTGYVVIAFNEVTYIPIENLKIIRGEELLFGTAALQIVLNGNTRSPEAPIGLKRVGLNSLSEIQRGNVEISENDHLCYINTIDWSDMIGEEWEAKINNTLNPQVQCLPCHENCDGHCWGPSTDECQKRTRSICHRSCGKSRCSGPGPNQCCHSECASGCTGPTNADCLVCRNVNDDGRCLTTCPSQKYIYDIKKSMYIKDAESVQKYFLYGDCVEKCPERTFIQDNECVKNCKSGTHEMSGECVPCEGNACDKECFGIGNPDGPLATASTVDAKNIKYFKGCNIVKGNVIFQAYSFIGDSYSNVPPITSQQLIESMSSIRVITGHLQIMSWHSTLRDFSVFANLTTIRGIELFRGIAALVIQDTVDPSGPHQMGQIQSLGFRSLKSIEFGNVYIGYMRNLCYDDTANWTRILKNPFKRVNFKNGVLLRINGRCTNNETCHSACDENGCWGPGNQDCLRCKNYSQNDICVEQCQDGYYQSGTKCMPCHNMCASCTGSGPDECSRCKYFRFQGVCVKFRPDGKCSNSMLSRCMPCIDLLTKYKEDRDGIIPK